MPSHEDPLSASSPEALFGRTQRARLFSHLDRLQMLICIFLIILHVLLFDTGRFQRVENFFLDIFFRHRPHLKIDPSLLMIEIDQESLRSIGEWPWPLSYHAQMIDYLTQAKAKSIVLSWMIKEGNPEENEKLAASMKKAGNVFLPVELEAKAEKKIWVHSLPIVLEPAQDKKAWIHSPAVIEKEAQGLGHQVFETDEDGVLRKVHWVQREAEEEHPVLALEAVAQEQPLDFSRVSMDRQGQSLIHWAASWKKLNRVSYGEVVRSFQAAQGGGKAALDPSWIQGKICLIGLTSVGQTSTQITPLDNDAPLVSVHAQILNSLLTGQFLNPAGRKINALCLILLGVGASLLFSSVRTVRALITGLTLGLVWLIVAYLLFWLKGVWISVFHPLLLIFSLFTFSALYHQFMAAKERKQLYELATRDGLTGLYVIRHFREILNQVVGIVLKTQEPLSVILIDIDHFKIINDTYGHPAGDRVLKKTAQIIFACLRSKRPLHQMDFVARYGGEEFIVLLRNTPLKDAAFNVADRIRKEIEKADYLWQEKKILVTASMGVAALQENEKVPDPMVHRADQALYSAKKQGRNRVCTKTISLS